MKRHILDRPRAAQGSRLTRYITQERDGRVRGPHHATNVLRRLPRGSGDISHRMKSYIEIERHT